MEHIYELPKQGPIFSLSTVSSEPLIYQPPKEHDEHLRKMSRALLIFFGSLFGLALITFLFADRIMALLPFSVEKQFVRPYEEMASRWFSDSLGEPRVEAYLQSLSNDLAEAMNLPEGITLSVHYIDSTDCNAFATLGGNVFVLSGLVKQMPDENSLAMVLAHEISHIKHRDPLTSMGRGFMLQLLISYIGGSGGETLSSYGSNLGLLHYSRKQEERSDMDALAALEEYYGHTEGRNTFFKYALGLSEGVEDAPEWLQTHPDLDKRIEAIDAATEEQFTGSGETRPIPEDIREVLMP